MEQRTSLTEIIEYIDPGSLNYQDWVNVGMALKLEGYPVSVGISGARKISADTIPENVSGNGDLFQDPHLQ